MYRVLVPGLFFILAATGCGGKVRGDSSKETAVPSATAVATSEPTKVPTAVVSATETPVTATETPITQKIDPAAIARCQQALPGDEILYADSTACFIAYKRIRRVQFLEDYSRDEFLQLKADFERKILPIVKERKENPCDILWTPSFSSDQLEVGDRHTSICISLFAPPPPDW